MHLFLNTSVDRLECVNTCVHDIDQHISILVNSLRSRRQIDGDAFHNGWCRVATYVATQFAAVSMAQQMV